MDIFLLFMFRVCHSFVSVNCGFVVTCRVRANLWSLACDVLLCFCHFLLWYPGSDVVLDCIDSLSLSPF